MRVEPQRRQALRERALVPKWLSTRPGQRAAPGIAHDGDHGHLRRPRASAGCRRRPRRVRRPTSTPAVSRTMMRRRPQAKPPPDQTSLLKQTSPPLHAPPRRIGLRRTWPVLLGILAVVAAVLLLLPTTTIARPALIAPVNSGRHRQHAGRHRRAGSLGHAAAVRRRRHLLHPQRRRRRRGLPDGHARVDRRSTDRRAGPHPEPVGEQPLPPNTQGPSAGLAFGLAGYLDATGSTLGARVAATGTLDPYGNVGPVSGVAAKAAIAQADAIDLLLVPERNTPLTAAFTGTVVEVATLTEALEAVCALPGSECVEPNTP